MQVRSSHLDGGLQELFQVNGIAFKGIFGSPVHLFGAVIHAVDEPFEVFGIGAVELCFFCCDETVFVEIKQGFGKYWVMKDKSERPDYMVNSLMEICNLIY